MTFILNDEVELANNFTDCEKSEQSIPQATLHQYTLSILCMGLAIS
jgi:hypothetical protein